MSDVDDHLEDQIMMTNFQCTWYSEPWDRTIRCLHFSAPTGIQIFEVREGKFFFNF